MKCVSAIIIVLSLFLVACDQQQGGFDKEQFEAFLKLKRIPLNDQPRYDRMLEEYKKRNVLAAAIDKANKLDAALVTAEVEEFRKQLLISRYFEQYLEEAVTDQAIQNFYGQQADKYKTRKAHVAHILLRVNPKMGEAERKVLLTKAHEAYSKITAGEDFAEVAKAVSEDKVSAAKGGSLGWINEGAVSAEFSQKSFAMKEGEVSEPFLTAFGFHIVKLIEAPQDVVNPLESVKGDIRYQLRGQSKQAEIKRLLDSVGYAPKG